MPIPPEKMSVLWDGHLARLSYFCKRSIEIAVSTNLIDHQSPLKRALLFWNSQKLTRLTQTGLTQNHSPAARMPALRNRV